MATRTLQSTHAFTKVDDCTTLSHCVFCDYQTQCIKAAVCKSCYSDKLKQRRCERKYSIMDTRTSTRKYIGSDGWIHYWSNTHYVIGIPNTRNNSKMCTCSMCGKAEFTEHTINMCQSCITCFDMSTQPVPDMATFSRLDDADLPYKHSVLTSRFPNNSVNPRTRHPGAILDVVPMIASFLLLASDEDTGAVIATLLNLMEAFQDLIMPMVIIGYIRDNAPRLYSVWHDFLIIMRYSEHYSPQYIPASFGYACHLPAESYTHEGTDEFLEYGEYRECGTCACSLRTKYNIGCWMYPTSRDAETGNLLTQGIEDGINMLMYSLVNRHESSRIVDTVHACYYMNKANSEPMDEELDDISHQPAVRRTHDKDLTPPMVEKDRRGQFSKKRCGKGKSKRTNYALGNYSLV